MKKVLIVDDEELFLVSLTEGLSAYADEFSVWTAMNGKRALEIINQHSVDLVVTDLKMPVMDGFQLLAQLVSSHPQVPVIVMTAFGTPDLEERIKEFDAFGYFEKPIDFQLLADKIRSGLTQMASGHIRGITLFSFLQLLEMEKKTCSLKIRVEGKEGRFDFVTGELINAVCGKSSGEEAAYEILSWEDSEIEIVNPVKKAQRCIQASLSNLLMESARLSDETSRTFNEAEWLVDEAAAEPLPEPLEPASTLEPRHDEVVSTDQAMFSPYNRTSLIINQLQKEIVMSDISGALDAMMKIEGALAAAVVDSKSGMTLGTIGGGINLEVAAAGNSEVLRSKEKVMANLGLRDKIEDILITMGAQYHIIRPLATASSLFAYLVLKRDQSNLALARHKLSEIEKGIEI